MPMSLPEDLRQRCLANYAAVQESVAEACRKAGREVNDVRIVGVTKYVSAEWAAELVRAGCRDLAESRPQLLWDKAEALAGDRPLRWHLVGHLQRNKVRRTVGMVSLIHSVDSLRLLEAIAAEGQRIGCVSDVLVEVNLTGDAARSGVAAADVAPLVEQALHLPQVRVRGLMGMAAEPEGPDPAGLARRQFAFLRELRDQTAAALPGADGLPELSMGMSGDFTEAILEGSTLVRIGSSLWEGIPRLGD